MLQNGMTPLMWAARNDSEDIVRALLDCGADIEAESNVRKRMFAYMRSFEFICPT